MNADSGSAEASFHQLFILFITLSQLDVEEMICLYVCYLITFLLSY